MGALRCSEIVALDYAVVSVGDACLTLSNEAMEIMLLRSKSPAEALYTLGWCTA